MITFNILQNIVKTLYLPGLLKDVMDCVVLGVIWVFISVVCVWITLEELL